MESVWDYVMRRKPIFLGYFALFLVSVFASCSLLGGLLSREISNEPDASSEPSVVQENPQTIQYDNLILSPQAVAGLLPETAPNEISLSEPTQPSSIYIELAEPSSTSSPDSPEPSADSGVPAGPEDQPFGPNDLSTDNLSNTEAGQLAATDQPVDVPLTGTSEETSAQSPRKVSIFRAVLAVLLAVTALTLAGFGHYQS